MDKLPRDELAERPAQFWRIQQCARVDLDIGSGGHPVVEQGGVFEDVGVSLDVGDEGQNTLLLQEGEGLPDEMGLVGSGKLHQHIRGIADAERLGIQLTELGGEVDFTAQLEAELHGFRSGRKRGCQCLIGGRTLLQGVVHSLLKWLVKAMFRTPSAYSFSSRRREIETSLAPSSMLGRIWQ